MPGSIHDEHPFADPEDVRDPVRRFRGRLSSPVTVVTAVGDGRPTGLTVSSLVVAGSDDAGWIHFVLGPESYLWDAIRVSGRFVVHVLDDAQRALADRFAGIRPSPGGPFAGVPSSASDFGPVLDECPNRARCRLEGFEDRGDHLLVTGSIQTVELDDLTNPLQWFRGSYRSLQQ